MATLEINKQTANTHDTIIAMADLLDTIGKLTLDQMAGAYDIHVQIKPRND